MYREIDVKSKDEFVHLVYAFKIVGMFYVVIISVLYSVAIIQSCILSHQTRDNKPNVRVPLISLCSTCQREKV